MNMSVPKPESKNRVAFTRVELLAVLAVLLLLAGIVLPSLAGHKPRSQRVTCFNNLRTIGFGWRMWAGDHDDLPPWITRTNVGGTMANPNPYIHFLVASNELVTPKMLVCPSDTQTRQMARDWREFNTGPFRGNAMSYAVGTDANFSQPRLILGLDRHCDGARVTSCGSAQIAPVLALEGLANPNLRWNTTNIHAGTGNLLFSDGTVRETTSPTLLQALKDSQDTSSNNHILPPR